jgi:hypothetical protein
LESAQCFDCFEYTLVGAGCARRAAGGLVWREAVRGCLCVERAGVVALCARGDARCDELDVVEVYDVEVVRVETAERAVDAGAERGGRVVEVGGLGAVATDFGDQLIGAAREFVRERLERRAEHDLGVVVEGRGVERADAVPAFGWDSGLDA